MQGSQEGKRAKLWGPRAHFGAKISMKIVTETGGFTVAWFVAMFENLTKSVLHMVYCLIWKSQGEVEGQHFCQATQNGPRTAIVFAHQ